MAWPLRPDTPSFGLPYPLPFLHTLPPLPIAIPQSESQFESRLPSHLVLPFCFWILALHLDCSARCLLCLPVCLPLFPALLPVSSAASLSVCLPAPCSLLPPLSSLLPAPHCSAALLPLPAPTPCLLLSPHLAFSGEEYIELFAWLTLSAGTVVNHTWFGLNTAAAGAAAAYQISTAAAAPPLSSSPLSTHPPPLGHFKGSRHRMTLPTAKVNNKSEII